MDTLIMGCTHFIWNQMVNSINKCSYLRIFIIEFLSFLTQMPMPMMEIDADIFTEVPQSTSLQIKSNHVNTLLLEHWMNWHYSIYLTCARVQDQMPYNHVEFGLACVAPRAPQILLREPYGTLSNRRTFRGNFRQTMANSNPWCLDDVIWPPTRHNWTRLDSNDHGHRQPQFVSHQCSGVLGNGKWDVLNNLEYSNNDHRLPMKMLIRWPAIFRWRGMNSENCSWRSNCIGTLKFGMLIFEATEMCSAEFSPKRLVIVESFL